jgi:hypothetical protein
MSIAYPDNMHLSLSDYSHDPEDFEHLISCVQLYSCVNYYVYDGGLW